jgi:uncharacterized cupin superfamily protein
VGITHFDEARSAELVVGHLNARWSYLGESAGSTGVGLRRIEIRPGHWSTPAHEHAGEEEIFYVLSGRGIVWQRGRTAAIGAGDCIVFLARRGAHTLYAIDPLDVLAFGPRLFDESIGFPRLGLSIVGNRLAETTPGAIDGKPAQFVREAELGPPELPEAPGPRPSTVVNVVDVESEQVSRPRIARTRRNLGRAAGSVRTGLQHVEVVPGMLSVPLHCHSDEEEMFVVLDGEGTLLLGEEETPVRPGSVVARPPATRVAHSFRAGPAGLTYLAYGTRVPGDICYYPTSNKILFGGVGVMARLEHLDYWDGED